MSFAYLSSGLKTKDARFFSLLNYCLLNAAFTYSMLDNQSCLSVSTYNHLIFYISSPLMIPSYLCKKIESLKKQSQKMHGIFSGTYVNVLLLTLSLICPVIRNKHQENTNHLISSFNCSGRAIHWTGGQPFHASKGNNQNPSHSLLGYLLAMFPNGPSCTCCTGRLQNLKPPCHKLLQTSQWGNMKT